MVDANEDIVDGPLAALLGAEDLLLHDVLVYVCWLPSRESGEKGGDIADIEFDRAGAD